MKHFDDARKAVARIVRFTLLAIIGLVSLTFAVQSNGWYAGAFPVIRMVPQ